MNVLDVVENLSEEMYLRLKHCAETGRWPEGTAVEQAQRDSALQIVMAYQAKKLNSDEMLTIGPDGKLVEKTKRELKQELKGDDIARFSDL